MTVDPDEATILQYETVQASAIADAGPVVVTLRCVALVRNRNAPCRKQMEGCVRRSPRGFVYFGALNAGGDSFDRTPALLPTPWPSKTHFAWCPRHGNTTIDEDTLIEAAMDPRTAVRSLVLDVPHDRL